MSSPQNTPNYFGNSNYLIPNNCETEGAFSSFSSDDNFTRFDCKPTSFENERKNKFNYSSAESENNMETRMRIKHQPSPLNIQKVLFWGNQSKQLLI